MSIGSDLTFSQFHAQSAIDPRIPLWFTFFSHHLFAASVIREMLTLTIPSSDDGDGCVFDF